MKGEVATSPETSARLSRIRQKGTAPELAVRRILTRLGLRYRTAVRSLPGSPDIVNRKNKWAIFVHGCFWHAHQGCRRATVPKANHKFWVHKLDGNRERDNRKQQALEGLGFHVVTVWQCELDSPHELVSRLCGELCPK